MEPYHLTLATFPFLGSSTFETTACLARFHSKLIICSDCSISLFSDNMLEGEIPVNLSYCSELSIISFRSNRLTGKIPSELGSLTKLLTLNLSTNNLTGGIPSSLGNLSSITQLSLAYNNLVGNVPEELCCWKAYLFLQLGPVISLVLSLPPS